MASKKKKSLIGRKWEKKAQKQPSSYFLTGNHPKGAGYYKTTRVNPFTNTHSHTPTTKMSKKERKADTFYGRTESTGARTQNPRLPRAIEDEAFSRNLDVESRRYMKNLKKELDAIKGRGYKGPLADVADKYIGPIANPIGDAIEKGYYKAVQGAKKIKRKITKKAKTALKKYRKKKKKE